jgi:hypothetical protein
MEAKKPLKTPLKERLGYLGLGIAVDYFIFKPVRKLQPLLLLGIGFVGGLFYAWGWEHLLTFGNWLLK